MQRRTFIKTGCLACLGSVLATGLLPGCASAYYASSVGFDSKRLVVKKTEFQYVKKGQPLTRVFVVVKHERLEFPVALYQSGEDTFTALYMQCTHQGCEIRPNDQLLVCPCHGSEFDRGGKVLEGPAEKPLKQFPVEADGENIYITLI